MADYPSSAHKAHDQLIPALNGLAEIVDFLQVVDAGLSEEECGSPFCTVLDHARGIAVAAKASISSAMTTLRPDVK